MAEANEKEGFSLKKFLFGKIDRKIFLLFFILAFLLLLVLTSLIYYNSISIIKKEIKGNLESTVQSRTNHIESYFEMDTERIKIITHRAQLKKDIEDYLANPSKELNYEILKKLEDSKNSIEEIDVICFINTNGIAVVCSNDSLAGKDFSRENFFIEGLKKEGAYFFNDEDKLKIIISGPILQNEKPIGVIITSENLNELDKIVKERAGLGETGEVLIGFFDKNKKVVYPLTRLFEEEGKNVPIDFEKTAEPMKRALKGESVFLEDVLDYRNVRVIAVTRYIPSIKLGVVAKIDKKETDSVRNNLIFIFIISVFSALVLFGLFSYFISKKITKPLKELTYATKELEKGNYKARVNIKTEDELEELGSSFNKTIGALERLEQERKQIDKAKTEFLSITSHELRSPMTPMKAQLQMVLGKYFGRLTKEQRSSLNIVLKNTEALDKIIVDFLEISRIEAARLKFNFVRTDLTKTIENVVSEMKEFMPEKKIKIETSIEKLPVIEVDPDRISQVLRNLINNSIKFTPENGNIEVSAKLHNGMILFSIKDNGIGMAEKDQKKLFEPFYQIENMYQHKSGGTGLGLAICKGIIESQNGKIWIISQLGKGTAVYFTVPLKPIREIKAIKLLFSEAEKSDELVKNIFREFIGPLGEKEFDSLKSKGNINANSIRKYIYDLVERGVIQKKAGEEFKNKVASILNREEKKRR